eukprot:2519478-Pyramimonas_sp.AAC.2
MAQGRPGGDDVHLCGVGADGGYWRHRPPIPGARLFAHCRTVSIDRRERASIIFAPSALSAVPAVLSAQPVSTVPKMPILDFGAVCLSSHIPPQSPNRARSDREFEAGPAAATRASAQARKQSDAR